MAEQRIDPREVRKIKTAIALEGQKKAERRFGSSLEMQQVQRELQQGQARAVSRHRTARVEGAQETTTKENKTMDEAKQKHGEQKPAPTAAQKRIAQRQQSQARQNARLKERSASRTHGMGM
ncbi:hypothetical protein [Microbacterium gorillae]|uniref:hypothetical protein n=1 Tax=Microbacterium gorillae TaxID=1231063 RepID=UPI003D9990A9